ncbi:contact-dependent growth inhibition system immunity protein [Curtobacterium flaccumfaciens]|nr:contact-dependent growth inhibition system immunity protein [Curtobacterium flaccumfaciens]
MDYSALKARTPLISAILSGAFHQDWEDDWDSAEHAWHAAVDSAPQQQVSQLDTESALLVESLLADEDVRGFLSVNASAFSPELDARLSPRDWVLNLRGRVLARVGSTVDRNDS